VRSVTFSGKVVLVFPPPSPTHQDGEEDLLYQRSFLSFGVVLLELISRRPPPTRGPMTCFDFLPQDLEGVFPSDCTYCSGPPAQCFSSSLWYSLESLGPEMLKQIAKSCVAYSPKNRPSFKEVQFACNMVMCLPHALAS